MVNTSGWSFARILCYLCITISNINPRSPGSTRRRTSLLSVTLSTWRTIATLRASCPEPYVLKRLDFNLSNCSPYPWIRKISKTGYNIHNRTLCKFLMEATLLNGQFVGFKPSLVAAVGMFTARKMLGESWVSFFSVHERYWLNLLFPEKRSRSFEFVIELSGGSSSLIMKGPS